ARHWLLSQPCPPLHRSNCSRGGPLAKSCSRLSTLVWRFPAHSSWIFDAGSQRSAAADSTSESSRHLRLCRGLVRQSESVSRSQLRALAAGRSENHFHVALMYDETEEDNGHATEDALDAFDKAYRAYIGPSAPARGAYLNYQGRPVIFIFPKRGHTDWTQVRRQMNSWEKPPILIYKDEPPEKYSSNFDGYY